MSCRAPGSYVEVKGPIVRLDEIAHLQKCLEELQNGSQTKYELNCMEPELSLAFKMDDKGRLKFVVQLTPDNLNQSHVTSFFIDQSYLPVAIQQCKSILENYPIRTEH